MQAIKLMIAQMLSLVLLISAAEDFLERTTPTILFIVAFFVFSLCSIYINRHEKELLKEIDLFFEKKELEESV